MSTTKKTTLTPFLLAVAFATSAALLFSASSAGCSPAANRKVANTALDIATVACIIANSESSDATIAKVCGIADALLPDLRTIVSTSREANRKYALEHTSHVDAGAP